MYAIAYYLFVTPAGFLYRLFGGDAMRLTHTDAASAFIVREHAFGKADFEST